MIRAIRSPFLVTVCMMFSSLASAEDLPRCKDLRSLSREAICFSNLALSNRSVLLERMATYSKKFMPPCSSMLPSSMVRAPIMPFLSWVDEQLLVVKQVEFVAVEGFLDGVVDNIDFVVGKEFGYLVAFSYATAVALLQIFGRPGNVELVDGDVPALGVDLLQGKGLARVYTEIFRQF